MKNPPVQKDSNNRVAPFSKERRSFLGGLATLGAGVAGSVILPKSVMAQPATGASPNTELATSGCGRCGYCFRRCNCRRNDCGPHLKSIKVTITNPTDENRPAENIVLSVPELKKIVPDFYPGSQIVTVQVRAGNAIRKYKVVKSEGPDDLVFQGVQSGGPLRDNNILVRFIKPAARSMELPWVNWRSLRTSHATWLKMAGADVKDAQAQMRHSRSSTTLDIYQQFVPESQQRAVDRLSRLVN